MGATEKQKQSLYFPEETLREIMTAATRLDRSLSWTVQQAWRLAREEIRKLPSVGGRTEPAPFQQRDGSDRHPASNQVREFLRGKFDRDLTS